MEKHYDVLVKDRLFFGGANDANAAVDNEAVDIVIDVRMRGLEAEEQAAANYMYMHLPIAEDEKEVASTIEAVAKEIVAAYDAGKNVYFHCGSGGGRAGVAATAVLLELGLADSLDEAVVKVKEARPKVVIRPNMETALQKLYEVKL